MSKTSSNLQSDGIYSELRRLIVRTEMKPGSLIEEAVVMERLKAGRTPLREALQRLVQDDLVRNVPRRGYFVTDTSASDVIHIFEVRRTLERLSARLAAERARPEHLREFEELLREGEAGIKAGNTDLVWNLEVDEHMHLLLARASGNSFLLSSITRHYALSIRVSYLSNMHMTLVSDEIDAYRMLLEALKRRDADLAEKTMMQHLMDHPLSAIPGMPMVAESRAG